MNTFWAIVLNSWRSAWRSRFFLVIATLLFLTAVILPFWLEGDGTSSGQLKTSILYGVDFVVLVSLLSSFWLGCNQCSEEVEGNQMRMVLVKPVSGTLLFAGKTMAVFSLHLFVAIVAFAFHYLALQVRFDELSDKDKVFMKADFWSAHEKYSPEHIDILEAARKQFEIDKMNGVIEEGVDDEKYYVSLVWDLEQKDERVLFGEVKTFTYNVGFVAAQYKVFLNYKLFVEESGYKREREIKGIWQIKIPGEGRWWTLPLIANAGEAHQIELEPDMVATDGVLTVRYQNLDDRQGTVVMTRKNGPFVNVKIGGFFSNYINHVMAVPAMLLVASAVGCASGILFSGPVAIFFCLTYLIVGLTLGVVPDSLVARGLQYLLLDYNDIFIFSTLQRGVLLQFSKIVSLYGFVIVKCLIISLLMSLICKNKEYGLGR